MKNKTVIYPGTFDPITLGHLDILKRAAKLFDHVILAIAETSGKQTHFTLDERLSMAQKACSAIPQIEVKSFSGLLTHYVEQESAQAVIRSLRTSTDLDWEFQLHDTNQDLQESFNTVLILGDKQYRHISSTLAKQILSLGGDITPFVPESVLAVCREIR